VEANIELGFPPDLRDYGIGAQILIDLGVRDMLLLTSSATVLPGSGGYGLKIVGRVPLD
jgi:3,4-dihydroxy 2-butanone 4-phosphate synthase/GTP cyclohydrolase II